FIYRSTAQPLNRSTAQPHTALPVPFPLQVHPQRMLTLPFGNDVRSCEISPGKISDERLHHLVLLRLVGDEGDLTTFHNVLALVRLVEERTWSHRRARPHVLAVILERCDEATVGPDCDECLHQSEPVLPSV